MDLLLNKRGLSTRSARLAAAAIGGLLVMGLLTTAWIRSGHLGASSSLTNEAPKEKETTGEQKVVLASPGRIEGSTDVINVGAGIDGVLAAVLVNEGQQVK